jgi:hypothetical protein
VAGCLDAFCLRWLSTTLLTNGQIEAAEPVLRHWQRLDPTNPEMQAYLGIVAPEEFPETSASTGRPAATSRRIRIDPAQSILVVPLSTPIISQATSADR